jgi:hypothetical protein
MLFEIPLCIKSNTNSLTYSVICTGYIRGSFLRIQNYPFYTGNTEQADSSGNAFIGLEFER